VIISPTDLTQFFVFTLSLFLSHYLFDFLFFFFLFFSSCLSDQGIQQTNVHGLTSAGRTLHSAAIGNNA